LRAILEGLVEYRNSEAEKTLSKCCAGRGDWVGRRLGEA
jgi:hypothetical protein